MDTQMFCFQCEQTAGCTGCTGARGVCGKPADVALEQDLLTNAMVKLALVCQGLEAAGEKRPVEADVLIVDGLFTCVTNVDFDLSRTVALTKQVEDFAHKLADEAGVAVPSAFDISAVWSGDEDVRSLKSLVLFGIRGMAAYAHHARVLGYTNDQVADFFVEALAGLSTLSTQEELLPLVLKVGEVNLVCMGMLDSANTGTYGAPTPTKVELSVEPGPFIVVTGHDLHDLAQLLEQTQGTGVNVYTHGEMLPAHAYPELAKYSNLKGNFGTAWQNQQKEFNGIPAPILFTTNCLMPPRASYADRVFTTSVVAYPELSHIEEDADGKKDFTPLIQRALELGGYAERQERTGINGGSSVTCGFGRQAVLSQAGEIVKLVQDGTIGSFLLVGGCDGAKPGRNYYTQIVEQAPKDSIILTLACGKYRFNDLDLGTLGGIPRILDVGQCNDAYGAIQIALALADAFECGVNELPLHFVLSWYEQKAVCILLTLLHLGIQNIKLGPTLPAFISPNVLNLLVDTYHIGPTTTPEADLAEMYK